MIHAGEQAVGIRRQVKAHYIGFFVCNMVKKSRILMSETIVILLPYV
jgi:hypothetical protein